MPIAKDVCRVNVEQQTSRISQAESVPTDVGDELTVICPTHQC